MIQQAKTILKNVFGFDEFRPMQQEVIQNILDKKDTLVIMPTGAGKSLCYQLPALVFNGLTVVVSPLISLMKDQVEQLTELGIGAIFLNSSLSNEEYNHNLRLLKENKVKLLYLAPEGLLAPNMMSMLSTYQVDCLTIDEAHCISEWGHDFRPEYRQIVDTRRLFPQAVCVALTATATPRVRKDIRNNLKLDSSGEFVASFNRDNLFIEVVDKSDPIAQTIEFIQRFPHQSGIIYCFSRRQVDNLTSVLEQQGFSVKPYHAGLSDEERKQHQEQFIRDDVEIVVATIAFGMGINKPDVRFVIHFDLPKNIESYYQEIGRAGRDGLPAYCLLLFSYGDIQKLNYFIKQKDDQEQRIANIHLKALLQFAETPGCRRTPLLTYFGEEYAINTCNMCDNCTSETKQLEDLTIPAQKFLSCVKRTGEIFGANHVIDVLLGSENQKVLKFGHNTLSTYGIGKEYSRKQWMHLSRQFLSQGLVAQDGEFGSLKLTPQAYAVFKGQDKVMGVVQAERPAKQTGQSLDYDQALFEILKAKRKELANKAGIPPYVIFSDKSLIDMAAYYPTSSDTFLDMHGVGAAKLQKYGPPFMEIIEAYCQEKQIVEKPVKSRAKTIVGTVTKTGQKLRYIEVGEAFNAGKPVKALMEHFSVSQTTILENLRKYLLAGNPLRAGNEFVSLSRIPVGEQIKVLEAFESHGSEFLKPVHEALGGSVPYDELHILRMHYLCANNGV